MVRTCAEGDSEDIGIRVLNVELPGRRQRGRPKRTFMDVMREVMQTEEDADDRERWRRKIRRGNS